MYCVDSLWPALSKPSILMPNSFRKGFNDSFIGFIALLLAVLVEFFTDNLANPTTKVAQLLGNPTVNNAVLCATIIVLPGNYYKVAVTGAATLFIWIEYS